MIIDHYLYNISLFSIFTHLSGASLDVIFSSPIRSPTVLYISMRLTVASICKPDGIFFGYLIISGILKVLYVFEEKYEIIEELLKAAVDLCDIAMSAELTEKLS